MATTGTTTMAAARLPLLLSSCAALAVLLLVLPSGAAGAGTADGSEEWGYVEIRPKAHMFWWLYRSPHRVENGTTPWPTVLWLQGGPGASGAGYGNFMEIGPLDTDLKPRATTWLNKADLLFVDNPVGTGFSFVEGGNKSLLARTDAKAASDLTALLVKLYSDNKRLQGSPLYIVAESYGGKFAVTTALAALKAISDGQLKAKLGGVALGDSWISPEDSVLSWGPLLYEMSRIDESGLQQCDSIAEKIKAQLKANQYADAEKSWEDLESAVLEQSNFVNFYNLLTDESSSDAAALTMAGGKRVRKEGYTNYLGSKAAREGGLDGLMDTVVKAKLGIVPKNFTWGQQSGEVFEALEGDFMKPRIHEVDVLLKLGVDVTIYSGQLDLICATKGTLDWVQKLKWDGLKNFNDSPRKPLYCKGGEAGTQGFVRSYKNLKFYWILGAGHMMIAIALPKWLDKAIIKLQRGFLWAQDEVALGSKCLVSWKTICRPIIFGGLGVPNLQAKSIALRLRWMWQSWTQPHKPWLGLPLPIDKGVRDLFNASTIFHLGNGEQIKFWLDPWMPGGGSLKDLLPVLFLCCTRKNLTVAQALADNRWMRHLKAELPFEAISQAISLWEQTRLIALQAEVPDTVTWRWTASGIYMAASAYAIQFEGSKRTCFRAIIWHSDALLRCRIFAWTAVQGRYLTADVLARRGWPHNEECALCLSTPETATHLLTTCPFTHQL